MPVISAKSAPDYQLLNFCDDRLQATNGNICINTILPEGVRLNLRVQAEPFYFLLKRLSAKELDLDMRDGKMFITAKNLEGEFAISDPVPVAVPENGSDVIVGDLEDFIAGLRFCQLGTSKDETVGLLSGVKIQDDSLWSCDKYRILNWKLKNPIGLNCCVPARLASILYEFRGDIDKMRFAPGKNFGGCFGITLKDGTLIWATTIEGEYKDLSGFFPNGEGAETITLDDSFPSILERHLGLLKDVSGEDKEVQFTVLEESAETTSQKFIVGGQKERSLREVVPLKTKRTGKQFEFCVNPVLLKDVVSLCLEFRYFAENSVVLFSLENKFRYLVKARS